MDIASERDFSLVMTNGYAANSLARSCTLLEEAHQLVLSGSEHSDDWKTTINGFKYLAEETRDVVKDLGLLEENGAIGEANFLRFHRIIAEVLLLASDEALGKYIKGKESKDGRSLEIVWSKLQEVAAILSELAKDPVLSVGISLKLDSKLEPDTATVAGVQGSATYPTFRRKRNLSVWSRSLDDTHEESGPGDPALRTINDLCKTELSPNNYWEDIRTFVTNICSDEILSFEQRMVLSTQISKASHHSVILERLSKDLLLSTKYTDAFTKPEGKSRFEDLGMSLKSMPKD